MARKDLIKLSAAALMVFCAVMLAARYGAGQSSVVEMPPDRIYFYDVETGELFAAAATALPPIDAPSGAGNGVLAVVYTCGECREGQTRIAYLEKRSDEGKKAHEQLRQLTEADQPTPVELVETADRERYVAPPPAAGAEPQWVSLAAPQGLYVAEQFYAACGEQVLPRRCNPPR